MIVRLLEAPEDEIGGKGAGLRRLIELGLPVPAAAVVPISHAGNAEDPQGVLDELGEPLAVRSSAAGEDTDQRSAAGQYDSVMGVRRPNVPQAVIRVLRSAWSDRAMAYEGAAGASMAVLVQREVPVARAGVAFSRDPVSGEDAAVLECVFGHGEQLVSGRVAPDRYHVLAGGSVRTRLALRRGTFRTLRTLRDDEAQAVATLTRAAEDGFGRPVDIEFCFDPDGTLWFLQCRAITTLRAVR